jgi:TonB family protein
MNTRPQQTQSHDAGIRLIIAFLISLALHALIISEIQVGSVEKGGNPPRRPHIEARLAPWPTADASEVLVKAIEGPVKSQVQDYVPPPQKASSADQKSADETPKPGIPEAAASPAMLDAPLPVDTNYYGWKDVDVPPSKLGDPVYPAQAAQMNVSGKVDVKLLLNENGGVDEVTILAVDPPGWDFDEAVLAFLKSGRFNPAMRKGRAVRSVVKYTFEFSGAQQGAN